MLAATLPIDAVAQVDPVFIALKVQRKALDLIERLDEGDEQKAACYILSETRADTIATVPSTPEGMVAYIDMIRSPLGWEGSQIEEDDLEVIFATFRAFVAKMTGGRR